MSKKHRQVFNEINITPLTDIFLVLLIIMMVVAPMLDYRGLKLEFFASDTRSETTEEPKLIKLTIGADGAFTVDGAAVAPDGLDAGIKQALTQNPDGIVIEADPESYHEATTLALDAAQSAGITRIAVTEAAPPAPEPEPQPAPEPKPKSKPKAGAKKPGV